MRPPEATQEERVLSGWKEIAQAMGTNVKRVQRLADRNIDPLPVWSYVSTVIAYPSALRDWRGRQKIPYRTAKLLQRAG